ncbi:MAG: helix-turn-helix domain-containing protein [Lachnospiraceae bacterium]|nr:helix-turn-helix domain-containing protein [Lachnospiraceae bacterium]
MTQEKGKTKKVVQKLDTAEQNTFVDKEVARRFKDMFLGSDASTPNMTSFESEQFLLSLVASGDLDGLEKVMSFAQGQSFTIGFMSANPVRQAQYTLVCMLTLVTRAAIAGGLPEYEAYNLSDAYLQQGDSMTTVNDLNKLIFAALRDFTKRVGDTKTGLYKSLPVVRAVKYIENHLHSKITLYELADYCNVTTQHLSSVFKKETGMTITEYIRSKRLKKATQLLRSNEYSVQAVSDLLSFSSPSQFIAAFKEVYGKTPAEWKKAPDDYYL